MADEPRRPVVLYGMTSGVSAPGFMRGQGPFLRQRGWDVVLACSAEGRAAEFAASEGLRFRPLPLERAPSVRNDVHGIRAVWRTVRQVAPDVAVWGSPKASLFGTLACRLQNVPTVYIVHGLRLEGASGLGRLVLLALEALTCRLATVVVADGYALRERAEALHLVPPGRAVVLAHGSANGVDPIPADPKYREELGLAADDVVVTFAGRLTRDKGVAELATAWAAVVTSRPHAHLVVAGRIDPTDPAAPGLEAALRALPNTHVIGHIDDLQRLWADSDLMVLPSYREGLPLVVIEAAAAGVPSVVTDCTGGAESVIDGETGLVIPQRDPDALRCALEQLIDEPETRTKMGQAARQRARVRYDRPTLWHALDQLLRSTARKC